VGRLRRTKREDQLISNVQRRLQRVLRKRLVQIGQATTDYALAKLLHVDPNRVSEWFVHPMKAISLPILHQILETHGINADYVFFDQGPEFRSADRPIKELGTAIRDYLVSEIERSYATAAPLGIGALLPSAEDLLGRLVHSYGEYVQKMIAANRMRAENARLRDILTRWVEADSEARNSHPGSPIAAAMTIRRPDVEVGERALASIADRVFKDPDEIRLPNGTASIAALSEPLPPVPAVPRPSRPRNSKKP
jgi:hypothetical protein